MNIIDYLSVGRNHPTTRTELMIATGLTDRQIRDDIEAARASTGILNMSDGKGYFIPDMSDPVEYMLAVKFANQQKSRAKSIMAGVEALERMIGEAAQNT